MDAVQVQYQPYTQDPTRQPWRNNSSNNEQRRDSNNSNSGHNNINTGIKNKNNKNLNLNLTNEASQNSTKINRTTPKTAPFQKSQNFTIQQQSPKSATFNNKNSSQQKSSSNNNNGNSLAKSPPKSSKNITTTQQKTANSNRHTPNPLNLSKATQLQNLGRVPQTATFPTKANRNYSLPNPPKTATFPKHSNGFPKDIRQSTSRFPTTPSSNSSSSQHAYALASSEQYLNTLEQTRLRFYNSNPIPARFTKANYSQVELGSGAPVVMLCHPDDSDSQESSPQTPRFLPSENFTGSTDIYDLYNQQQYPYEDELLSDDGQQYSYYYDQSQEYIPPSTPTSNLYQQRSNTAPVTKDERRKSVFGGPMKVHPDTIVPVRQPKGPEMTRNFATRIRRKAVNKIHAATAERRSKSAADRRKSAMF